MGYDILKDVASAHSDRTYRAFVDEAASNLDLHVIGSPDIMNLVNRICATTQINYKNLPSFLLELDRILRKYGASTRDQIEREEREEEAEMEREESGEEDKPDSYELDSGEAFTE